MNVNTSMWLPYLVDANAFLYYGRRPPGPRSGDALTSYQVRRSFDDDIPNRKRQYLNEKGQEYQEGAANFMIVWSYTVYTWDTLTEEKRAYWTKELRSFLPQPVSFLERYRGEFDALSRRQREQAAQREPLVHPLTAAVGVWEGQIAENRKIQQWVQEGKW